MSVATDFDYDNFSIADEIAKIETADDLLDFIKEQGKDYSMEFNFDNEDTNVEVFGDAKAFDDGGE